MRTLLATITFLFLLSACTSSDSGVQLLQNQVDSLTAEVKNTYKPGFGDFMGTIQNRHSKLWFAGWNENWELAAFEMHEIEEVLEDIRSTYPVREETQFLPMIDPGLRAVNHAIKQQSKKAFREGYLTLTNTCNACHQATEVEFIKMTTPTDPPYDNQVFTPLDSTSDK